VIPVCPVQEVNLNGHEFLSLFFLLYVYIYMCVCECVCVCVWSGFFICVCFVYEENDAGNDMFIRKLCVVCVSV